MLSSSRGLRPPSQSSGGLAPGYLLADPPGRRPKGFCIFGLLTTHADHLLLLASLLLLAGWSTAGEADRFTRPEDAPAFREPSFITQPSPRAYPGALYEARPAVTGGTWPYRFALRAAPDGMTIDEKTGAIAWKAPMTETTAAVAVTVTDVAGRKAEQSFSVMVGKAGFVFVSPDGDDANPGTFEKPWKTVMRASQSVADPANTTLYLRGGTYPVEAPADSGKKNANTLKIMRTSPRRWVAWPGEKPVIDLGWSEEQWKAALAAERAVKKEGASTGGYGHRVHLDQQIDGLTFDGLEVKNASFYMFVMWDGNRSNLTWRRCNLHHLWADWRENACFIFGFASDRKYDKAAPGESFAFGKRPQATPYRHIVLQDCAFSDVLGEAGAGLHWYTTQGCLVEDCRFERTRGECLMDKDNGWDNTYRNNIFKGDVIFAAQGCNDGIDFHHNFVDGGLFVGWQPGWIRNFWLHHNAIRGGVRLIGGGTQGPVEDLNAAGRKLAGPADPDAQAIVRDYPRTQRLVFAWGNAVDVPDATEGEREKNMLARLSGDSDFAKRFRYVWWDGNLMDEAAVMAIGWGGGRMKWSEFAKACGFDAKGATGTVTFDDEGHLPANSPWRARFGRDAIEQTKP